MIADDRDAVHHAGLVTVGGQQVCGLLREITHRKPGRDVPQGQHRVRLAAAEIGLQVDHRRRVVVAGQAPDGTADEIGQSLCQVSASEERHRVGIVRILFSAEGNLVEVSRKFGGREVSRRNIIVRWQHFPPRLEAGGLGIVDSRLEYLLVVFVRGNSAQIALDGLDFVRLGAAADQPQQALGSVQGAVGIVVAERTVVCPRVSRLPKLNGEGLPGPAERFVEWVPALPEPAGDVAFGQHPQLHLRVEWLVCLGRRGAVLRVLVLDEFGPGRAEGWVALSDH